ncbi:glycosyltransferase family 2 protein [Periconia macrospinosa]|uniref:Glycosyltransferase family 2 protein n=1 Tax=Periconia macrospinosa TaxID=97972 RepID=A0A2V1EDT6_9PLEO|nr:glycosyltransferase family 2 protein [Periconia macrospinosa]
MGQLTAPLLHEPPSPLTPPYQSLLSKLVENQKKDSDEPEAKAFVPTFEKWCNFFGCLGAAYLFYLLFYYSDHLWTFDTLLTIFLSEYCGWSNERFRRQIRAEEPATSQKNSDPSLLTEDLSNHKLDCIAAIVGYREDPAIFTKALESYLQADGCRFILTCVDGNKPEDRVMVDIFKEVYPTNSAVLDLPIPFIEIALQMDRDRHPGTPDAALITKCVAIAKHTLLEHDIHVTGRSAITRLCVTQPHMHKKGIMFTSFVICFALSELLGIDFVWTSDSDSMVHKDTTQITIQTIAGDAKCVGASTALTIHNRNDSFIATLGNTVYLNELHLTRCFSSAIGANDCQSGPCAAFRIKPLRSELLAWYKQTVCGFRMIVNEDRHMTTRLLLPGHRIRYIPHAITATETPVTLRRWLLQQVRWARAVHVEAYVHPTMYLTQPPLFFFAALRREITTVVIFSTIMTYLFVGVSPFLPFHARDFVFKFVFTAVYLKTRNPINPTWEEWCWSVPAGLFYIIPLPAVQMWSFVTMLAGGWGTSMRGFKEAEEQTRWEEVKRKTWEVGFFVVWMGIVGGVVGRWIGTEMGLDAWGILMCMGAGMTALLGGFGYWMAVAE